jgi:hypothetical protein
MHYDKGNQIDPAGLTKDFAGKMRSRGVELILQEIQQKIYPLSEVFL